MAAAIGRPCTSAKSRPMSVAHALPLSVQMPKMMALVLKAMSCGIPRAEQGQGGSADGKHRELSSSGGSDTDEVAARRGRRRNYTHAWISVRATVTNPESRENAHQ